MEQSFAMIIPISKAKSLVKIFPRVQNRNPTRASLRENVSIDFETDNKKALLLGDNFGNRLERDNISFENIMRFLFNHRRKNIWAWNAEYEYLFILKSIPKEILRTVKNKEIQFEYQNFRFFCIPKKILTIRKAKESISIFDLAQFYGKSLLKAYQDEFPKEKLPDSYITMKEKIGKLSLRKYNRQPRRIRKYNEMDCILTKRLADKYTDSFFNTWNFYPRKYISAGNTAEKIIINNGIFIPRFNEVPYPVQEGAWASYYGGRFEQSKKGFVGKVWIYDINSAYPDGLRHIPDITNGNWITKREVDHRAVLGFYQIVADVNLSLIGPFPFRTKNNLLIFPVGKFQTWVTLAELKAIANNPLIQYTITQAYQFIPNKSCIYPYKEFIESSYAKRKEFELNGNFDQSRQMKLLLNSMYGKTAERLKNNMGNLFNPVIASTLSGWARAKLLEFVRTFDLSNHVVAFATDSIVTQKEIPGLHSEKLGELKLDKHGNDGLFISNGYYRINDKWSHRGVGFDPDRKQTIEHTDTFIDKHGMPYIKVKATQLQHFKSALLRNKLDDLGKITKYDKEIRLNSDRKRIWDDHLKNLTDDKIYTSIPININEWADKYTDVPEIIWKDNYEEWIDKPQTPLPVVQDSIVVQ